MSLKRVTASSGYRNGLKEFTAAEMRAAHPELGEIRISSLGVVIGAHTGPGLLTVFYLCNKRVPG